MTLTQTSLNDGIYIFKTYALQEVIGSKRDYSLIVRLQPLAIHIYIREDKHRISHFPKKLFAMCTKWEMGDGRE